MQHLTNKELRDRYEYALNKIQERFIWTTTEGKILILQEMRSLHLLNCVKKIQKSNKKHLPESIMTCDLITREMRSRNKVVRDEN